MSFSDSNSRSACSSSSAAASSSSSSPLPSKTSAKILILSTVGSSQAAFIATACGDHDADENGNDDAGLDNNHAGRGFETGVVGDSDAAQDGRIEVNPGMLLRFREVAGRAVCFVTTPELDGGMESARRLRAWLADMLSKQNARLTGVIFLHSATEVLVPGFVDALEVIVGGREEMKQVHFVSSGWKDLSARESNEAESHQRLVNANLCARMIVQGLKLWRYDGSASRAQDVVQQIVVDDEAARGMDKAQIYRLGNEILLSDNAKGTVRFPPWLQWLLRTIATFSFIAAAVWYWRATVAMQEVGNELANVQEEIGSMAGLLAKDPKVAGVVATKMLSEALGTEEFTRLGEEFTRMVGLLGDDPKAAGVVLKEVLSGVLGVEYWPVASPANLWTKNVVVNGVTRQTESVKPSEGVKGLTRVLVELSKLLGNDRETVARTLAEVLGKLGDDREALAGTATEILYKVLGSNPQSAVVVLKDLLGGVFGGDAKPGPGSVWEDTWEDAGGQGNGNSWEREFLEGKGKGQNWEKELLEEIMSEAVTHAKRQSEKMLRKGGTWQDSSLAYVDDALLDQWVKKVRESQGRDARDARGRWGGWGQELLALVIGLCAAVVMSRRAGVFNGGGGVGDLRVGWLKRGVARGGKERRGLSERGRGR